jgi:hypothetical protein
MHKIYRGYLRTAFRYSDITQYSISQLLDVD